MTPFSPAWFLTVFLLPGLVGAAVLFACSIPASSPSRFRIEAGWSVGIGLAIAVAMLVNGGLPNPLLSTHGLFLLVMLPALVFVGAVSAWPKVPRQAVWGVRALLALGIPALLLNFMWSKGGWAWPTESLLWLAGLGLATGVVWLSSQILAERSPGRSLTFNVGLTCAFSGPFFCMTGGIMQGSFTLSLGVAIAGALLISLRLPKVLSCKGSLAVAMPCLLGLLIQGRFVQTDSPPWGVLVLALAPLTQWVSRIPWVARRKPWQIGLIGTLAILIPLMAVLIPVAWAFIMHVPEEGY